MSASERLEEFINRHLSKAMAEKVRTAIEAKGSSMQKRSEDKKSVHCLGVERVKGQKKIIIPDGMEYSEARIWLKRIEEDEETIIEIDRVFQAYPTEGAAAFAYALDEMFGFFQQVKTPGFFGDSPPESITIPLGPDPHDTIDVPWGRVEIPTLAGYLNTGMTVVDKRVLFRLGGAIAKKHAPVVTELGNLIEKIIRERSIYAGRAFRISFPEDLRQINPIHHAPKFMPTDGIGEGDLIFSQAVDEQVQTGIFSLIRHRTAARRLGATFKRGICLCGTYGCGKTLTARVAAKLCVDQGITFIHLDDVRNLAKAIEFAKTYQPAVIFAEDIDRAMAGEERDVEMDEILNTIDGIGSKTTEIMVVLTTNHIDTVNSAMLRPGRLDQVIHVTPPDAEAVERLLRLFGGNLIDAGTELTPVGEILAGEIPAVIRETIERAKLAALGRTTNYHAINLDTESLCIAARGIKAQREFLNRTEVTEADALTKLASVVGDKLGTAITKASRAAIPYINVTGEDQREEA